MNAGRRRLEDVDLVVVQVAVGASPISTTYKGYDVFEMPPQTQGFATLEMLNILEECGPRLGYDLRALGPRSAEFWSILVQAKRLAYADLLRYNGDPRFVHVPVERLISKRYAASLCSQISLGHVAAASRPRPARPAVSVTARERGDTVYLTTADRWGNMVSFIYSIYDYFGAYGLDPGVRVPDERPRVVLRPRPVLAERDRAAQAAVPDDHPGVRHEGRPAAAAVRQHGRRRAGAGPGAPRS